MSLQPRILMCRPDHYGIHYEINPWMKVEGGYDPARAAGQWDRLHATLLELGARIDLVAPEPGLPDQVFTANAGLVHGNRIILSRFRHEVRQREAEHFDRWFRDAGFEVVHLPDGQFFEGAGDALFCGDTLFGGYRHRSEARSHHWVGQMLGVPSLPMELVDPRFYHLDTCFCPLDTETALYFPGAFDDYGRAVLRHRIPNLIEVEAAEAVTFACNAVAIDRTVVLNQSTPRLSQELERYGYRVIESPLEEFLKAGGSAKCLTLRLDGEQAAAWSGPRNREQAPGPGET